MMVRMAGQVVRLCFVMASQGSERATSGMGGHELGVRDMIADRSRW